MNIIKNTGWKDRLNQMDELWVPTIFQKAIFVENGVVEQKIRVIPEPIDVDFFDQK